MRASRSGYFQIGQGAGGPAVGVELSEEAIYAGLLVLSDAGYLRFDNRRSWGRGTQR